MKTYMADVQLPDYLDEDFLSMIPHQRMVVNRMMEKGTISTYALAMDRSRIWITINAQSERQVKDILQKMPLYRYMSIMTYELAFSETPSMAVPQPSLN